jgi:D-alanyl-lipoteichoic acid acyltransferase DltB (MBOAT superfamily)
VYRGKIEHSASLFEYAIFISFFPLLLAGPIERAGNLLPQIRNRNAVTAEQYTQGIFLIVDGLFRKIVIADNMALIANAVFNADPGTLSGPEVILGTYAYGLQIYGDFSGYTNVARGLALCMGFRLVENFNFPYLSASIREFWRRWHMSLSSWLRDYVYVPLGGSRVSETLTVRNILLTFLLCGLWHGAGWTFIAWGLFHGVLLARERLFASRKDRDDNEAPRDWRWVLNVAVTLQLILMGWLLFRSDSLAHAQALLVCIFGTMSVTSFFISASVSMIFYVSLFILYEIWQFRNKDEMALLKLNWRCQAAVYGYMIAMMLLFRAPIPNEFIYFQF